jgi:hypothetical protein
MFLIPNMTHNLMGVGSYQALAQGKGVHCEVESERSRRQIPELRNTNDIRHILTGGKSKIRVSNLKIAFPNYHFST